MRLETEKSRTNTWSELVIDNPINYRAILNWLKEYESPYSGYIEIYSDEEGIYLRSLTLRFESREDHMAFALTLMGS